MTVVYRKGPEVTERDVGGMRVTEVFGYDPVPGSPQGETLVDMVFVTVGVMAGNGMLYFMPNEKLLAALH